MSKLRFEKSRFRRFFSSSGFYVALAICVLAVGVATFGTISKINSLSKDPGTDDVAEPMTNIPAPTTMAPTTAPATEAPTKAPTQPKQDTTTSAQPKSDFLVMPIGGDIIKEFTADQLVFSQTFGDYRAHNGIDIKTAKGEQVKAAGTGTVSAVYADALWGTVVEIDHGDGLTGIYSGLNQSPPIKKGDKVDSTTVIGSVDTIPAEIADEPHLHFSMKVNGKYVDPVTMFGAKS